MIYKVLVNVYVPEIEQKYEIYIPINRNVKQVSELINKLINSISKNVFPVKPRLTIYNRTTGVKYESYKIIRETDIRNGTELVIY